MPSEIPAWPLIRLNEGKSPVIFLHGFMGSKNDWLPVANLLSREYECILFDLPGHGENLTDSPIPQMENVIYALDEQRRVLNIERWDVVGYSLGGRIALRYELQFSSHVKSLTMISSSPGIDNEVDRANRRKQDQLWAELMNVLPLEEFIAAWYEQPIFRSLSAKPELLSRIRQFRQDINVTAMSEVLTTWGQGTIPSVWPRLPSLPMPCLYIAGKLDEVYCRISVRVKNLLPAAQIAIVENAGHAVHLEQSEDVAVLIRNFIHRDK
jgi:2-succinyl-6-hydroxy-2,4-cyclohexadiene-1-carboxylate synthase